MPRRFVLILLALLLSAGTFFLAQLWLHGQMAKNGASGPNLLASQQKPSVKVLVAKTELPAGTILTLDSLRWQVWAPSEEVSSYLSDGKSRPEDFVGAVVRTRIAEGEPLVSGDVARPGDRGFMAAVLGPGMRAVSVNVAPNTGNAGFVEPGDHVDVLMTSTIVPVDRNDKVVKDGRSHKATETLFQDVRVVGVDQTLADVKAPSLPVAKTVTLEVTPKEAEVLSMAAEIGDLSMVIRSLAQGVETKVDNKKVHSHTWDNDLVKTLGPIPNSGRIGGTERRLIVVRGSNMVESTMDASSVNERIVTGGGPQKPMQITMTMPPPNSASQNPAAPN